MVGYALWHYYSSFEADLMSLGVDLASPASQKISLNTSVNSQILPT